jgi:hypothetical protein
MKEVKTEQGKEQFPKEFSVAFKRWLAREIRAGRMTIKQSVERFNFESKNPYSLVQSWLARYKQDLIVTLPVMTEKERMKLEALQKRIKELEKQLEHSQMKNIALETLIDVAEEQLKVPIRKKAGARQ